MSTEAKKFAPTRRRGDPGASGPGLVLAQSGGDDDTDYDYYDTPSGNIWRPGGEPGQPAAANPSLSNLLCELGQSLSFCYVGG